MYSVDNLKNKIDIIRNNISNYNQNANIIAVTKGKSIEKIKDTFKLGINNIGESYSKEALNKYSLANDLNINWHFIGALQTNKIKDIADKFTFIHSVYKTKHLDEILKRYTKKLNIFFEYNNEYNKSGLKTKDELFYLCDYFLKIKQDKIKLLGLMTMAPYSNESKKSIPYFENCVQLKDELNKKFNISLNSLSMGMSSDYIHALKLGATHIRIGSLLYE
jgi:PLP dependent protein